MKDDLDSWLQTAALQPPADFSQRVMQAIQQLPPAPAQRPQPRWRSLARLAAAAGWLSGGLLGLSQLLGFVLSYCLASAAI